MKTTKKDDRQLQDIFEKDREERLAVLAERERKNLDRMSFEEKCYFAYEKIDDEAEIIPTMYGIFLSKNWLTGDYKQFSEKVDRWLIEPTKKQKYYFIPDSLENGQLPFGWTMGKFKISDKVTRGPIVNKWGNRVEIFHAETGELLGNIDKNLLIPCKNLKGDAAVNFRTRLEKYKKLAAKKERDDARKKAEKQARKEGLLKKKFLANGRNAIHQKQHYEKLKKAAEKRPENTVRIRIAKKMGKTTLLGILQKINQEKTDCPAKLVTIKLGRTKKFEVECQPEMLEIVRTEIAKLSETPREKTRREIHENKEMLKKQLGGKTMEEALKEIMG